ncbi:aminoglycoside phosphotransferase family protein [Diaphorobacter aerolatus]|uniref:Phosphotransferase n=1 Tax=Diaphorobacter aerolatus TaxID=1288495 RepID=A0A7H0GGG6_9BURK|nr:phosphotransferase [Diaphorobacter aerolatus]QNP47382.1 phosphotransferase [Diaphorobacter aerolatus]
MSQPNHPTPAGTEALSKAVSWSDPARGKLFNQWLAALAPAHGLLTDSVSIASADASFRRYLRVQSASGATYIIMDAPPDKEDCHPFVHVQKLLHQARVLSPEVLAWDEPHGFMLITDFGDQTLIGLLNPEQPAAAHPWYLNAVDTLIDWQNASRPGQLPEYNDALLRRELHLFPDWYLGRYRQATLSDKQQATLARTFDAIIANNLAAPSVFVHRDYMTRNLMVAEDRSLAVLDFQDAVYGPVTYDIASLLRDAFISWDEDFVIDITVRYWEKARRAGILGAGSATGWGADFGDFYRAVDWMALQRHLKVAGIFARLTLRDGKPKYLADTPRFIAYIRQTAGRYRELTPLLRLVDEIEGSEPAYGFAYGRM